MLRTRKIITGIGAATLIMWAYMLWWAVPAHAETFLYYENGNSTPVTPFGIYDDATDDANLSAFEATDSGPPFTAGYCITNDGGATWFIEKGTGAAGHFEASGGGGLVKFNDDAGPYYDSYVYNLTPFLGTPMVGAQAKACWSSSGGLPSDGSACVFGVGAGKFDACDTPFDLTGDLDLPPATPDEPRATIILPTATEYNETGVPFRFSSEVCADDYAGETVTAEWEIQKNDSGWSAAFEGTTSQSSFRVDDAGECDTGMYYGIGGLPDPRLPHIFTSGNYRIRLRTTFDGVTFSDWTSYVEFGVGNDPFGGGGGGSWGGGDADSGDGSSEDWNSFFDGVPTHDDIYGACKFLGFDAGVSENDTGDGLPCLWSWVRYALIPPAEATFNFVKRPFDTLMTRWPIAYVTTTWTQLEIGLAGDGECPIPEFFAGGNDMFGDDLPTVDACGWLDPIADYIDGSAFAAAAFVFFLWCVFVAFCVDEALKFFE